MKFTITKEPDLMNEALLALELRAKERSGLVQGYEGGIKMASAYYKKEYNLSREQYNSWFAPLVEVEKHVFSRLKVSDEQLKRDFSSPSDELASPARIVKELHGLEPSHEMLTSLIYKSVTESDDLAEVSELEFSQFVRLMAKLQIDQSYAWTMVELCADWERRKSEITPLLVRGAELFSEKLELVAPLIDNWYDTLAPKLEAQGVDAIYDSRQVTLPDMDYLVRPSLEQFSGIGIWALTLIDDTSPPIMREKTTNEIHYGLLYNELGSIRSDSEMATRVLQKKLRALGDKQRLGIMAAIAEGPKHAGEIVKMTGLTAPTITHHMQELLNAEFVHVDLDGGKRLYSLNSDCVDELISDIRKFFDGGNKNE